jgi:hypothetical protein
MAAGQTDLKKAGAISMKLVRYGAVGKEKPGMIDKAGMLRDLSSVILEIDAQALGHEGMARLATASRPGRAALRHTRRARRQDDLRGHELR